MYQAPSGPQSIGGVLDSGFRLFRDSLRTTFVLALLAQLAFVPISEVGSAVETSTPEAPAIGAALLLLAMLIVLVPLGIVLSAAVVARIYGISEQRVEPLREVFNLGLRRALPFVGAALLWVLGAMLGTILLVIPGIYLMIAMAFGPYAAITEGRGPISAIRYSFALTRGHWWRTAALLTIVGILMFVIYVLIAIVAAVVFAAGGTIGDIAEGAVDTPWYFDYVIGPAIGGFLSVLTNAMALAVMADLKLRYEGADIAERIAAAGT